MRHKLDIEMLPIIQARAAKSLFIQLKPSRLNDPKLRADRYTRPADIPRILGNLRLIEHHMSGRRHNQEKLGVGGRKSSRQID